MRGGEVRGAEVRGLERDFDRGLEREVGNLRDRRLSSVIVQLAWVGCGPVGGTESPGGGGHRGDGSQVIQASNWGQVRGQAQRIGLVT